MGKAQLGRTIHNQCGVSLDRLASVSPDILALPPLHEVRLFVGLIFEYVSRLQLRIILCKC